MNGKALPLDSPEMNAMLSYMAWLSKGVPTGVSVAGRGFKRLIPQRPSDPVQGQRLYIAQCALCHGVDGQGMVSPNNTYGFPALWGPRSFNIGAGMARLHTAAAFIKWNMPLGQGGSLSDQDAYDIAAYFTHQPRPDFPGKEQDWPQGGKPDDARY